MRFRVVFISGLFLLLPFSAPAEEAPAVPALGPSAVSLPSESPSENIEKIAEKIPEDALRPVTSVIDVLEFSQADILPALEELAKKSGLNIVTHPDLRGVVSLNLQNIAAGDALRIILDLNHLAFAVDGDRVVIQTADEFESRQGKPFNSPGHVKRMSFQHVEREEALTKLTPLKSGRGKMYLDAKANDLYVIDEVGPIEQMQDLLLAIDVPRQTREFVFQYTKPKDVLDKIEEILTKNVGSVEVDEPANRITVTDTPRVVDQIAAVIREKDKRREVFVEGKIFQVRLKEEYTQGIDWEAIVSDYKKLDLDSSAVGPLTGQGKLSIGKVSSEDYAVLLEALDTVGEIADLGSVNVNALINQPADIVLTAQSVASRLPLGKRAANPGNKEIFPQDRIAVSIKMLSGWQDPDFLTLNLSPQIAWKLLDGSGAQREIIGSGSAGAVDVQLRPDEVVVLGGLLTVHEIKKTAKVPVFGYIPILGSAFRHQNKFVEAKEYVIFLLPKVKTEETVSAPAEPPG